MFGLQHRIVRSGAIQTQTQSRVGIFYAPHTGRTQKTWGDLLAAGYFFVFAAALLASFANVA
ncbi:MAG: hypothetical protein AAGC92_12890 [Pseudomonadota bacterium]